MWNIDVKYSTRYSVFVTRTNKKEMEENFSLTASINDVKFVNHAPENAEHNHVFVDFV